MCCRAQVPVLAFFTAAAGAAKEAAMATYVQQQLEYGKLWKLVESSQARPQCFTNPPWHGVGLLCQAVCSCTPKPCCRTLAILWLHRVD